VSFSTRHSDIKQTALISLAKIYSIVAAIDVLSKREIGSRGCNENRIKLYFFTYIDRREKISAYAINSLEAISA
jgi:hypothetical protein